MTTERLPPPPRYSGILAHPTSFPGGQGIGDLGAGTATFLEWLAAAGQSRWQVLPLGPTGYGDSPYQSFSAFAGNPLIVSLDALVDDALLEPSDLEGGHFPEDAVDFGAVIPWKFERLRGAAARLRDGASPALYDAFQRWSGGQAGWLDDYALFMALKSEHSGASWLDWQPALRLRDPDALAAARERLSGEIDAQRFMQFVFFRQWRIARARAHALGIQIIGDVPIFVALDSADVWANRELFQLDADGRPTAVAGVPPDYFSETGQLWGNPLYDWERLAANGYRWWVERLRAVFELVDIVRIDHFRGFEAYWSVPAGEQTAINGTWCPGPGAALFDAIRAALGDPAIIAEDLGVITPAVDALRLGQGFPGMAVLQFAFGSGPHNLYLPHNLERRTVVYTGTHDNDTTLGWWATLDAAARAHATTYLRTDSADIAWDLIRAAWSTVAETAIAPLQDVLCLGGEARMNLPGRPSGNWSWRMGAGALTGAGGRVGDHDGVVWSCKPSQGMSMMMRIRAARAINTYDVELTWDDGQVAIVDFAESIAQGGVFAPLDDPAFFSQLTVDPSGRFIAWPGDIDFCAEALRLSGTARKDAGRSGAASRTIRPAGT